MIDRYTRGIMSKIWSSTNRYQKWVDIELSALQGMMIADIVPTGDLPSIPEITNSDTQRIEKLESQTKHEFTAFLAFLSESIHHPLMRYIHYGMTSSDVMDTTLSLLLKESGMVLLNDLQEILSKLKNLSYEYQHTPMIGRTHGMHAEPITLGLKIASWYTETQRNINRLIQAIDGISTGKISGAVGTYAHLSPVVEEFVCKEFDLEMEPVSTQIIPRDRHAEFFTTLAICASSIERFATEIRNLQRTEIAELAEPFSKEQQGSSAMPHKRNPILAENLCGMARLIRGYALCALEDISLWGERDLSHSSVERIIAPDTTIALDFMLTRFLSILNGLTVDKDKMQANLDISKDYRQSQTTLLNLIQSGLNRQAAYSEVQRAAIDGTLQENITIDDHKYIDTIFKRIFNNEG